MIFWQNRLGKAGQHALHLLFLPLDARWWKSLRRKSQAHQSQGLSAGILATKYESYSNTRQKKSYNIGHDTYFKQIAARTETRLLRAKRLEVPYVREIPQSRRLELPQILHKILIFSPTHLNLTVLQPPFSRIRSSSKTNNWRCAWSSQ